MGLFSRKSKAEKVKGLSSVDEQGWTRIFDWIPGAWQSHSNYNTSDSVISYAPVFACLTLISGDIAKLRPCVQEMRDGVWVEVEDDATAVLRKPNNYQNHIQFKEYWMTSKLLHGNAYALKYRENRKVTGLLILDPTRVTPLVSESGEVFYQLHEDNLSRISERQMIVPASEIIHDRENCLYHPLVGLPPLYACTVTGQMGLELQGNAKSFFENGSNPGGILTAPGSISDEAAQRLKEGWFNKFGGTNSGQVAVAGDGLTYQPLRMSNVDAQLLQILNWTAESVCSVYHVPSYKVGVGPMPTYNNIEALTQDYYTQCLQKRIEAMEASLDAGLELSEGRRVQLDLDGLFRMDTSTLMETLGKGVQGTILASNEARKRLNLPPVKGGEAPLSQQQYYSLEALAERDANEPFSKPEPEPMQTDDDPEEVRIFSLLLEKELAA